MIKAIIFDYFGVIFSDEYWRLVKTDKNIEQGEFHQLSRDVNLGAISWQQFIEKIAAKLDKPAIEVAELYSNERIDLEVAAYLAELHQRYKTALLTNASYEYLQAAMERTKLTEVFDEIVVSSKVGMLKPDRKIFTYTLRKLGVKPEEAVFIDDITRNIDGAKAIGVKTILYKNFGQMKTELEQILKSN